MPRLDIHEDAQRDLDDLRPAHPGLVRRILAILQEIKADPRLLSALLDHGFGDAKDETVGVKKWLEQWNAGRDIWRLKIWELESVKVKYRIIYAYVPGDQAFVVLAVQRRDAIDYDDPNHALTQRIHRAYRNL